MEKSLYDYLNEFGYKEPRIVTATLKALAFNGVTTIDVLMKMKTEEIAKIKGIGPRAMNLISKVITKEEMVRKRKEEVYKMSCSKNVPCTCLRDWFMKAGLNYLSACQLQKILKRTGVDTIEEFMSIDISEYSVMNGIADRRLEVIAKTKKLIESEKKQKNVNKHHIIH